MKKGVLKIVFAFLVLLPVCANATPITKDFYTDGQIVDGNVFDTVNVWNTATVNMSGGQVFDFNTYQTSTVNFSGGDVAYFHIHDDSQLNASGGWIHNILDVSGSGIVNFTGGETHGFQGIKAGDFSIVNIYGYNLHISNNIVIGYWADNSYFNIPLSPETASHVVLHEIPEPLSILLFSFSSLLIIRQKH